MEQDIDCMKEAKATCQDYIKLLADYDVPTVEVDVEKMRPYFQQKVEKGMSGDLTTNFMSFTTQVFSQLEQIRDGTTKLDSDWNVLTEWSKRWNFEVIKSQIVEIHKL